MADAQTEFREAHERYKAAHDEFVEMMRAIIEGRDDWPLEERLAKARDLQRLHAEFVKAGEPFMRRRGER